MMVPNCPICISDLYSSSCDIVHSILAQKSPGYHPEKNKLRSLITRYRKKLRDRDKIGKETTCVKHVAIVYPLSQGYPQGGYKMHYFEVF